ncbi:hypothetical protein PENSPDRAFT_746725 [Peniophora sp. CONT]|nr:hypothetical protein PENSPDRAFT_746725 [Peniophora sp. CONT]
MERTAIWAQSQDTVSSSPIASTSQLKPVRMFRRGAEVFPLPGHCLRAGVLPHPKDTTTDRSAGDSSRSASPYDDNHCMEDVASSPPASELSDSADEDLGDGGQGPDDLDEPWDYEFMRGDSVWVKATDGNWHRGTVSALKVKKDKTRQSEGFFYPVIFGQAPKLRKYFAPLNGEIKPDSHGTRQLLREAGYELSADRLLAIA